MSSLAPAAEPTPLAPAPAGGVRFVAAPRHADLCAELTRRRYVVAPVTSPDRGRLRHAIDEAVEGALAMRGALPPAEPGDALDPTIRDQVFRARALGATGLALALPRLGDGDGGVLDVDDSAALSAWISAAKRTPLLVLLEEQDRAARVLTPVHLGELAEGELTPPPSGEVEIRPPAPAPVPPPPILAMPRRGVMKKRSSLRDEAPEPPPPAEAAPIVETAPVVEAAPIAEPPPPAEPAVVEETPVEASAVAAPQPEPRRPNAAVLRSVAALMPAVASIETPAPPSVTVDAPAAEPEPAAPPPPAPAPRKAREGAARRAVDAAEQRQHAIDLDRARGPKPVSVIERLFATKYMPLVGAMSRGEVDAAVKGVVDGWKTSFEHSYREAFAALRVTGKRPPMVFDAPDIAARIGRLNGARAIKLLLCDAMRFDVGERVGERLKESLAGRAVCVERMLLWSALPTTTPTQLGLLARGADALRDAEPSSEPEPEIARGRAVGTVRRDRVGSREVMKLDLVEARLRGAGPAYDERIDALADEVAPILVRYIEGLPPRTLIFLFGDHGFRLPSSADGHSTGPATQGGVSPEEVLVPAQAWLLGGVH